MQLCMLTRASFRVSLATLPTASTEHDPRGAATTPQAVVEQQPHHTQKPPQEDAVFNIYVINQYFNVCVILDICL